MKILLAKYFMHFWHVRHEKVAVLHRKQSIFQSFLCKTSGFRMSVGLRDKWDRKSLISVVELMQSKVRQEIFDFRRRTYAVQCESTKQSVNRVFWHPNQFYGSYTGWFMSRTRAKQRRAASPLGRVFGTGVTCNKRFLRCRPGENRLLWNRKFAQKISFLYKKLCQYARIEP